LVIRHMVLETCWFAHSDLTPGQTLLSNTLAAHNSHSCQVSDPERELVVEPHCGEPPVRSRIGITRPPHMIEIKITLRWTTRNSECTSRTRRSSHPFARTCLWTLCMSASMKGQPPGASAADVDDRPLIRALCPNDESGIGGTRPQGDPTRHNAPRCDVCYGG
jgi:hypothetical protein